MGDWLARMKEELSCKNGGERIVIGLKIEALIQEPLCGIERGLWASVLCGCTCRNGELLVF